MYRYIIVDDQPEQVQNAILCDPSIAAHFQFAGQASEKNQALDLIGDLKPEIILTETSLKAEPGLDLLYDIRSAASEQKIIVISNRSDYESMKTAIEIGAVDYLQKPVETDRLAKALKKAADLLRLEKSGTDDMDHFRRKRHEELLRRYLIGERNLFPSQSGGDWEELFHADSCQLFLVTNYEKSDLPILFMPGTKCIEISPVFSTSAIFILPPSVQQKQHELEKLIQSSLSPSIKASYCPIPNPASDMKNTFRFCRDLLDSQGLFDQNKIVAEQVQNANNRIEWGKEDHLLFAVESGNLDATEHLTGELFLFYEQKKPAIGDVKRHISYLFKSLHEIIYHDLGESFVDGISQQSIEWCFDYQKIKEYSLNTMMSAASTLKPYETYASDHMIQNIIHYLNRNYMKQISLQMLSDLFYIDPSYCSALFKKQTGVNYSLYLKKLRIKKAMALLSDSRLTIAQIARSVGFNSSEYFFNVFKKMTGMTPNEYRNMQKKGHLNRSINGEQAKQC